MGRPRSTTREGQEPALYAAKSARTPATARTTLIPRTTHGAFDGACAAAACWIGGAGRGVGSAGTGVGKVMETALPRVDLEDGLECGRKRRRARVALFRVLCERRHDHFLETLRIVDVRASFRTAESEAR